MESAILGAMLQQRTSYELVREACSADWATTFSPLGRIVAQLLEDFYDRDQNAEACPKEVLTQRAGEKFTASKHAEAVADFISRLDGTASVPNIVHDIRVQRRNRVGDELVGLLANRDTTGKIDALIKTYQDLGEESNAAESSDDVYHDIPVLQLLHEHFTDESTISLGLDALDAACDGGARPGHHVLVYARPEIGKTLFTINMVAGGFLRDGRKTLYIGNEDPISDILFRVIARLTRRTKDDIRRDPEGTQEILRARNYGSFIGVNASPGTFPQIERLCDKHQPEIVVLDQLRNLNVGDDNRVTALEKAAIAARNLAKSRNVLVVSVTQAGDSAEGKSFLELSDIDFSKTGIPGAIDLAIGIGGSDEDKRFGVRHINLPKNKLGGQHTHFSARFDTKTGVVEEFQS